MDISGGYTLHAPREQVWDALLDPDILKRTVPGAESLERTGDNEYAVRMNVAVAGIKGAYRGTLKLLDAQRPDSYRIVVDGTGARGILHGDGTVRLEAGESGATVVRYSGQAQLGGTIASVGTVVASAAANMLIKQYFTRLADLLPTSTAPAAAPALAAASVAAPAPTSAPPTSAPPAEALSTVAPGNAQVSQPAAAPEAPPISPATPAEPVAPAAAAMAAPVSSTYADNNIASGQTSARTIGAIASVVAIVIVALVIWLIVSRQ